MAKGQGTVASDKTDTIKRLPAACRDEAAAVAFLEQERWGDRPMCARCGSEAVYQMQDRAGGRNKRYLWRCKECNKQYSVRTGTVMEDSRIPLQHWCYAFWAACSSKKGVSALQIKRMTGLTYKSALFLMNRIRYAMADQPGTPEPLDGVVEADECYVGGKPRNKGIHNWKRVGRATPKAPVIAVLQRGGDVRPRHVQRIDKAELRDFILGNVHRDAVLMTDEATIYKGIGAEFQDHKTVLHGAKEYCRHSDGAGINGIESFFAIVKRAIHGTYHAVSKKHLHRYLDERAFVYNTRRMDDGARVSHAIRKAEGKRLYYRAPAS